jgi:hypothetical protein
MIPVSVLILACVGSFLVGMITMAMLTMGRDKTERNAQ